MSAHIFVVEDEKPIQTLLRYNLEKEGFKVSSSENGEEALSLIKEKIEIPFLVAGGIDESNFKQALSVKNCIGIDVCSSIEDEPGIKNPIKVRNLLKKVRSMNV